MIHHDKSSGATEKHGKREWSAARKRQASRAYFCAAAGLIAAVVFSPAALADSTSVAVTDTAGQPDPASGVPRVFTISGTASVPEEVFVKYRPPGGAPCAPNALSDSGLNLSEGQNEGEYRFAYGTPVNGAFALRQVYKWAAPGPSMFCLWVAHDETAIATPFTQTITFRSPVGAITGTVSPSTPAPGQQVGITIAGSSETPANVYAKLRPAGGAPCAPTFEADSGESLVDAVNVNGSFSTQATITPSHVGQYLVCLWLAQSRTDTSPVSGPRPLTFWVAVPKGPPPEPPPCLAPRIRANTPLSNAERRIRAAHCAVGRLRYAYSKRVARRRVVSVRPSGPRRLALRTPIEILVSSGPPPSRRAHRIAQR